MTLGEKIRTLRKAQGLTQAEVGGKVVSRNMLCLLEKGQVMPSIETLRHIADVLKVPVGYLLDEDDDLFFYKKKKAISKIKKLFYGRKYDACIQELQKLDGTDDECAYLFALCYTECGVSYVKNGNLERAKEAFTHAEEYCAQTAYDTTALSMKRLLYLPVARNVQSPLLEFDEKAYLAACEAAYPTDFYKYLMQDTEHTYRDGRYQEHIFAKRLMRERRYADAALRLHRIEDTRSSVPYDAYLFYGLYTDLEACYKELFDFEKAYRYAAKRMSLLESFHS